MRPQARRQIRWASRACFAVAAGSMIVGAVGLVTPATAQAGGPPNFLGTAYSAGMRMEANTDPAQVIPEIFAPTTPEGEAEFGSGNRAEARATVFDPGLLATGGAGLLCTAGFPCQSFPDFPPRYPLAAEAEYPQQPESDAAVRGGDIGNEQFTTGAGDATASATPEGAHTLAVMSDVQVGPAVAPVLFIGSIETTTDLVIEQGGLSVRSRAFLSDISMGAGALTIDSIEVVSHSFSDGDADVRTDSSTEVSGARDASGNAVDLTDDGFQFGGTDPVGGDILGGISGGATGALAPANGSVRTVGASDDTDGTTTRGSAQGVLFEYQVSGATLPGGTGVYNAYLLGNVASAAFATLVDPSGVEPDFAPIAGGDIGPISGANIAGVFSVGTADPVAAAGAPSTGDRRPDVVVSPGTRTIRRVIDLLADAGLEWFYLAWTLSLIGAALLTRSGPLRLDPSTEEIP